MSRSHGGLHRPRAALMTAQGRGGQGCKLERCGKGEDIPWPTQSGNTSLPVDTASGCHTSLPGPTKALAGGATVGQRHFQGDFALWCVVCGGVGSG